MTQAIAAIPEVIPQEVLFGNPEKTMARISPNGKRMAYLAPVDNVLNVWVGEVGKENYQPVTNDTDRGIRLYSWAEDNQHILYLQDRDGNENWRLYAVDLNSGETRDLTPQEDVQAYIVAQDKHFPNELLIAMNQENPQAHDVYHLNLTSGEMRLVAKNPGNVAGWVADAAFKVRAAFATTPEGGFDLLVRETEESEWQTVGRWSLEESPGSAPVAFTQDGKMLYLKDARNANAARLVKLDIASGQIEVIAEDAQYDLGEVLLDPDSRQVQAVSFNRARREWVVLDEAVRTDFEVLQKLNAGDMHLVSADAANDTWLVAFQPDNGPTTYYVYDRTSQRAEALFEDNPELAKYVLAPMEPITFPARDGLTLQGYITFPPGWGREKLPLVLLVHGGPTARDSWGYSPGVQWLANRGYICLQINYRGSTGYGKAFELAGLREWGGKMHTDLVDGINWAVAQGYADSDRLAIFGGSYGGYAALVGATFTPDLFRCAVDIVGPSNLVTLLNSIPPYWTPLKAKLIQAIGDPDIEPEFLQSRSPLFKVDQIKIPILIGQGANDPRVKQAESEQIVAAMQAKGIAYEYMLFPDEGHGFAKPENRLRFYTAAEEFLAKHLKGRIHETPETAQPLGTGESSSDS